MIEEEQLKRNLEEDDEVLNIINNSTNFKKLKETNEDIVMSIIENSINNNNETETDLNDQANNDQTNNGEEDEILNIIDNSINNKNEQANNNEEAEENTEILVDENSLKLEKLVPKAAIHQVETEDGCLHEVVTPIDVEYKPLRNFFKNEHFKPAKEYPFAVDPFQREAILCIENNQSVLVSAHTSAGKLFEFI